MDLEDGLMDLLKADATLTGLVNGSIFASDRLPDSQNSYPALCFWCIHDAVHPTLTGVATLASPIYQFHFYALQLATVKDIRNSVRRILEGYSGQTYPSGVCIEGIVPYGGRQIPFLPDTMTYGWELEYTIHWQEFISYG